jgi:hypothetical protein
MEKQRFELATAIFRIAVQAKVVTPERHWPEVLRFSSMVGSLIQKALR